MRGVLGTLWFFLMLSALFTAIGWLVGSLWFKNWVLGAVIFLALAGAMNIIVLFAGEKIVVKMYRGKYVTRDEAPRLWSITERVALRAEMPMPKVAILPSATPNAFATGRSPKHATVAATKGIMELLNDEELDAVMSHEMSHVKNRDTVVMTLAATIAGAIAFAARMFFWGSLFGGRRDGGNLMIALIVMVTAPLAAMLIQLAVSRTREYMADRTGAEICGKPYALARALEKLELGNQQRPMRDANPAHSALFIANPFRGRGFASLFSTHPPMKERVRRLMEMQV